VFRGLVLHTVPYQLHIANHSLCVVLLSEIVRISSIKTARSADHDGRAVTKARMSCTARILRSLVWIRLDPGCSLCPRSVSVLPCVGKAFRQSDPPKKEFYQCLKRTPKFRKLILNWNRPVGLTHGNRNIGITEYITSTGFIKIYEYLVFDPMWQLQASHKKRWV
jgi:hypothetical protein